MTNFEKAKEFVETHKKEIATAGVGIVLCKKLPFFKAEVTTLPKKLPFFKAEVTTLPKKIIDSDLAIPENLKTCTMTALWKEGDYVNSIVNNVCLSQMGEFGVELIDNLDCIEPDVPVDLIIGFLAK